MMKGHILRLPLTVSVSWLASQHHFATCHASVWWCQHDVELATLAMVGLNQRGIISCQHDNHGDGYQMKLHCDYDRTLCWHLFQRNHAHAHLCLHCWKPSDCACFETPHEVLRR